MIEQLLKEHLEMIHAQMEHKEEGKVPLKNIPDLIDMLTYQVMIMMSKHFCDFQDIPVSTLWV